MCAFRRLKDFFPRYAAQLKRLVLNYVSGIGGTIYIYVCMYVITVAAASRVAVEVFGELDWKNKFRDSATRRREEIEF